LSADLPSQVRVRISSEAAGDISLTPVVSQTIPIQDLIGMMLGACGKDVARIRELLMRGSTVQGASRFRWDPIDAALDAIEAALAAFPDPDPSRSFDVDRCVAVRVRGAYSSFDIPRAASAARRFLKRRSFWDEAIELAAGGELHYVDYLYRECADRFRLVLDSNAKTRVRSAAKLLKYRSLSGQIEAMDAISLEFLVQLPERCA
jgi:hypothetical protein